MSAAIAVAPSPAPHDRSHYVDMASAAHQQPSSASPPTHRQTSATASQASVHRNGSGSPRDGGSKSSPTSARNAPPPKIIVKKEPTSPGPPTSRHRPRKLDLTRNASTAHPGTAKPSGGQLTSRDSALGIIDVGLACLSPGFVTQDPTMREQLQRSISVREQQRQLIESRLQQTAKPSDAPMESAKEREMAGPGNMKTPMTSRRKAPPGLSIVAPSHEQFANERVIQSAPLHQSFTGRHQPHPLTRHVANQPSNLSNTSHIHHVPANQTSNRLPPISDVFAAEALGQHREATRAGFFTQPPGPATARPSFSSPNLHHAPQQGTQQPQPAARPREYRSAEDVQAELSGGRPELLPKIVHYGGHQPPTPPSPMTGNAMKSARRRPRAEFEDGEVEREEQPGGASRRRTHGPFGEGRDSPEAQRRKKEEFLRLCDRAWDLFHS